MHIKKTVNHFLAHHKDDEHKIEAFASFLNDFFENMGEEYVDVRDAFEEELEDVVCEINMEMVDAILNNLKSKEGTKPGIKWSMEETTSVAKQYDVPGKLRALEKEFDELLFYFAMNYVFIIHNNVNRTLNGYIDLAIDEYANKNICIKEVIKKLFKKI